MFTVRHLIAVGLVGSLFCGPASLAMAQTTEPSGPSSQQETTVSKIEKTLTDYLQRGLDLLTSTVETMVPYQTPEFLPNGDILIRRAPEAPKTGTANTAPATPVPPPASAPVDKGNDGTKT